MILRLVVVISAVVIAIIVGCSKGESAGIPLVKPIVSAAVPDSLENFTPSRLGCTGGSFTLVQSLACRIFNDGPANIIDIVGDIDSRINEINARSAESTRACLKNTPVDLTSSFVMPDNATGFPFFAQCYDVWSVGEGGILFGKKDGIWYLQDGSTAAKTIVKVDADGNVDGYFIVGLSNSPFDSGTRSVMHFKASQDAANFEFSVAGVGVGYCSSKIAGNGTNVYISAESSDAGAASACDNTEGEACASATDLSGVAQSNCNTLEAAITVSRLGRLAETGHNAATIKDFDVELNTPFSFGVSDITAIPGVTAF